MDVKEVEFFQESYYKWQIYMVGNVDIDFKVVIEVIGFVEIKGLKLFIKKLKWWQFYF